MNENKEKSASQDETLERTRDIETLKSDIMKILRERNEWLSISQITEALNYKKTAGGYVYHALEILYGESKIGKTGFGQKKLLYHWNVPDTYEDTKLFKKVLWLYDRLTKDEMNVLMKWVHANCEVIRQETEKLTREEISHNGLCERFIDGKQCSKKPEIALCIEHFELAEEEIRADQREKLNKLLELIFLKNITIEKACEQLNITISEATELPMLWTIIEAIENQREQGEKEFYDKGYSDGFNDGDKITEDMKIMEQQGERQRITSMIEKLGKVKKDYGYQNLHELLEEVR